VVSSTGRDAPCRIHVCRTVPLKHPCILSLVGKKLLDGTALVDPQLHLVKTVLHNAGIYNGIVAGGLFWAASGEASLDVARVMLIGAVVAGVFGAVTIDWPTAVQAVFGIVGLVLLPKRT
jgi:hypothetical protein